MNYKISIIVPIYNSENDLDQCIESIVNQTYKNIEIILVNDGSTDGSLDICKKWEKEDSRIIVIDKQNGGLASSRNAGLEKATGELIGFVDHDDYIEPEMYEIMQNDMVKNDVDIVMCNSFGVYEDLKKIQSYEGYVNFIASEKETIERFLNYEKLFCSSVWSKLYKRTVIGNIRFVDEIILGEDYYFNGRIYPRIKSFYYENKPLYNYRIREGSMSRNIIDDHFFDKYLVVERLSILYIKNGYVNEDKFNNLKLSVSYEILYRLYEYDGTKEQKKEWKKIFKSNSKRLNGGTLKDKVKVFMMKYFTLLYVKGNNNHFM